MADLTALLERVKAATGPDRELDFALERLALDGDGWEREDCGRFLPPKWIRALPDGDWFVHGCAPPLTASLDAALALVLRILPDWTVRADIYADRATMGVEPPLLCNSGLWTPQPAFQADAKTAPLALLAALLTAMTTRPDVGSSTLTRDA